MVLIEKRKILDYRKKANRHLTLSLSVFLVFLLLAILMVVFANPTNSLLFQFMAIIFSSLGGCYLIFDYFVYMAYFRNRAKLLSSLLLAPKEEGKGILLNIGEKTTIRKDIQAYPLTIKTEKGNELFYWLEDYGPVPFSSSALLSFTYAEGILFEVQA